jgi:hypothetical protein
VLVQLVLADTVWLELTVVRQLLRFFKELLAKLLATQPFTL